MNLSIPELQKLQKESTSFTEIAKQYCKNNKIQYSDNIRRKVSRILNKSTSKHNAKVLIFDLETSPYISYHWDLWNQNISYDDVVQDWKILTFSAKWLFEDKIMTFKLTQEELKNFDDSRITKELWKLLDEANIVIAHNLIKFDQKRAMAKFLEHGLKPPSTYLTLDTLLHARKKFALPSNRLDAIGKKLGIGRKVDTPKGMWKEVMQGNYKMLNTMATYCNGDISLLEDVYLTMRPFITPHPNLSLFIEDDISACPSCGSDDLKNEKKPYATTTAKYDLLRCNCCGALSRNRKTGNKLSSVPY